MGLGGERRFRIEPPNLGPPFEPPSALVPFLALSLRAMSLVWWLTGAYPRWHARGATSKGYLEKVLRASGVLEDGIRVTSVTTSTDFAVVGNNSAVIRVCLTYSAPSAKGAPATVIVKCFGWAIKELISERLFDMAGQPPGDPHPHRTPLHPTPNGVFGNLMGVSS